VLPRPSLLSKRDARDSSKMQIAMSPEELLPDLKLRWLGEPADARLGESSVAITAGAATDWFIDPSHAAAPVLNAPALVGSPSGDFLLSSRVAVEFASTFDAGALVLYGDQHVWAKLCFELSPAREPMVVSVVTRDLSDDCNSAVVDADHVWLRVSRIGSAFAFHSSSDGATWSLVRHFALPTTDELLVGFEAQSPLGEGCTASFTEVDYAMQRLSDIRSGA
jgi:regulation of enolase protein 1 (concanavalin A-like superfamily)